MTNFLGSVPADVIDTEDDDTIEMELSESAMRMLSQAAALAEQPCPSPNPTPPNPAPALNDPEVRAGPEERADAAVRAVAGERAPSEPRPAMSTLRLALLLSAVAVASALLTAVTYIATTRTVQPAPIATSVVPSQPAPVIVARPPSPPPPAPSAEPAEPVRFVNPFDRKEVFEFPAGTSKADARDAVAELLYERAQERRDSARGIVSGLSVRHPTNATAAAAPAARKAAP
jgi:hypothetical protein